MSSIRTASLRFYNGVEQYLVNCPGRGYIPIKFCDNCMGCLGMEYDEGRLYVFCSEEDS